jgi:hypothetical protein
LVATSAIFRSARRSKTATAAVSPRHR